VILTFLVLGGGIGLVAGVSPGPVLTLVVSETLRVGQPSCWQPNRVAGT
jgi:threonine/homoserine/homoserine lactone efflux protein